MGASDDGGSGCLARRPLQRCTSFHRSRPRAVTASVDWTPSGEALRYASRARIAPFHQQPQHHRHSQITRSELVDAQALHLASTLAISSTCPDRILGTPVSPSINASLLNGPANLSCTLSICDIAGATEFCSCWACHPDSVHSNAENFKYFIRSDGVYIFLLQILHGRRMFSSGKIS